MKHCMNTGNRDSVMKVSFMNVDEVQEVIDYVTAN